MGVGGDDKGANLAKDRIVVGVVHGYIRCGALAWQRGKGRAWVGREEVLSHAAARSSTQQHAARKATPQATGTAVSQRHRLGTTEASRG